MACHDRGDDHCCWINGKVCSYLVDEPIGDRRWVCSLYRKLGSWKAVDASEEWIRDCKETLIRCGATSCGDWPVGADCATCGKVGR